MYRLRIVASFDASHYLPFYKGKCSNLHGHTWKVVFCFKCYRLNEFGITMDFFKLKNMVNSILPDHQDLNKILKYPTAENIAYYLFKEMKKKLRDSQYKDIVLEEVEVWESNETGAIYSKL